MESAIERGQFVEDSDTIAASIDEAQDRLLNLAQQVKADDKRIILTHQDREIAAIISIEAFAFLERAIAQAEDESDLEDCQQILAQTQPGDWISLEELKKEIGLQ